MTNIEKDIRDRIINSHNQSSFVSGTEPTSKTKNRTTFLLGVTVIAMSILTLVVLLYKKKSSTDHAQPIVYDRVIFDKQPLENSSYAKKNDLDSIFSNLNKRLDEQDRRLSAWSNRLWLIGVAHNENVNLLIADNQKRGIPDPGYIYFDANWKLSGMPKTIDMDDKSKEDLQKYVK